MCILRVGIITATAIILHQMLYIYVYIHVYVYVYVCIYTYVCVCVRLCVWQGGWLVPGHPLLVRAALGSPGIYQFRLLAGRIQNHH